MADTPPERSPARKPSAVLESVRSPSATVGPSFHNTRAPEYMEEQCRRADWRFLPREREVRMRERAARFDRIAVIEHRWNSQVLAEGATSATDAAVMLVTNNESEARFSAEVARPGDVILLGPGATHMTHGRRRATVTLILPAAELQRQLASLLAGEVPDLDARRLRFRLSPGDAGRLHEVLVRPWREARRLGAAGHEGTTRFERDLVGSVCRLVARAWPSRDLPRSRVQREAILMAALDVIRVHSRGIDLTSLCGRVGCSAETLRLVFQEFLGVAPMLYVKKHRLHECRRLLRDADPSEANVKTVAYQCGFGASPGRFAQEYRAMFGELPSETLRSGRTGCAR